MAATVDPAPVAGEHTVGDDRHPGIGLKARADLPSAILLIGGLLLGGYVMLRIGQRGSAVGLTVALGIVAARLLLAFVERRVHTGNPLLPARLFRSRAMAGARDRTAPMTTGTSPRHSRFAKM